MEFFIDFGCCPDLKWIWTNFFTVGTNWCGTGDIASNYHDLGFENEVDRCCRTHDLCPVKIRAYQRRYDLTNEHLYTKYILDETAYYNSIQRCNVFLSSLMASISDPIVSAMTCSSSAWSTRTPQFQVQSASSTSMWLELSAWRIAATANTVSGLPTKGSKSFIRPTFRCTTKNNYRWNGESRWTLFNSWVEGVAIVDSYSLSTTLLFN